MKIIGISCFYHDSAAALIVDGQIISAVQEERFTRVKHDAQFPINSIKFIIKNSNIKLSNIDAIVFYDKPFIKFERILETFIATPLKSFLAFKAAIPTWLKEKLFLKKLIFNELNKLDKNFNIEKIKFSEHHLSHAASAFFPSNFEKAIILTLDGVGEWATSSVAIGNKNSIKILKEISFPHSLGLLYSAFTYYLGFKVNSGEYKVMGLAPYGEAKYLNLIKEKLIDIKEDGSFRLNLKYFNYISGLTMTNKKFEKLFGVKTRKNDSEKISQFHMDISASIQAVTEEILIKIAKSLADEYKIDNLCLAGGVALNCVANSKILQKNYFKNIWVQPASGDAGGSLGAALAYWYCELEKSREIDINNDSMRGSYLGPSFDDQSIKQELDAEGAIYHELPKEIILKKTAEALSENKAIGWFQGKMEFGPRALGNRSILANPLSEKMQNELNQKIKFRESFRPFAPSIIAEETEEWFDIKTRSDYMLFTANIHKSKMLKYIDDLNGFEKLNIKRSIIPSVTHVDNSARVQTVHKSKNKIFYNLIKEFKSLTGCPILINTSFNIRGEPIVCCPSDAFKCFMGTNLDILSIGSYFLIKDEQVKKFNKNYMKSFPLD